MEPHASRPTGDAAIEHEAAVWLARQDRELTAAEQDGFLQWLGSDPRHGEWLARHRRTVAGLKLLAQWKPEHGAHPNPDLLASPKAGAPHGARDKRRAWLARRVFPVTLAAAACAIGALAFWWARPDVRDSAPSLAGSSTAIRKVLEDGSSIALNRDATVEVLYTAHERRVRLTRGEALFTVAKNPQRPFTVHAGRVEIHALGTVFDVRLQPETIEVLVAEGRVQVRPPSAAATKGELPVLTQGRRAIVSLTNENIALRIDEVSPAEMARALAWQTRELEFNDTPLAQVVAEFNRDNRVKMIVDDPALASVPIGATLRSDNVEGFVRLLEWSFHVKAEYRVDGVILLRRAEQDVPRRLNVKSDGG